MKIHAQDGYRGPSGVWRGVFLWSAVQPTCFVIGAEMVERGIMLFIGPFAFAAVRFRPAAEQGEG